MTVVCDSWSLVSKEQGNSLPFLCLYLERSLCSLHADTRAHAHTHLPYSLPLSAVSRPLENLHL